MLARNSPNLRLFPTDTANFRKKILRLLNISILPLMLPRMEFYNPQFCTFKQKFCLKKFCNNFFTANMLSCQNAIESDKLQI